MLQTWTVIVIALLYVGALLSFAYFGDRRGFGLSNGIRPHIYSLAIAVFCTSWTFYGSIESATIYGISFTAVAVGAGVMMSVGYPLVRRIVTLSQRNNTTSLADFMGARYGKSQSVAVTVTIFAVIATVPFVGLQLRAVIDSIYALILPLSDSQHVASIETAREAANNSGLPDIGLFLALAIASFTILFGTRRIEATEHHGGLVLSIAVASLIKLFAALTLGVFVTYWMFDGFGDLTAQMQARPDIWELYTSIHYPMLWILLVVLSAASTLLFPHQFHMIVVENRNREDLRTAAWAFPLYLIAINIFVLPLTFAGYLIPGSTVLGPDMLPLTLPRLADMQFVGIIAYIGGISASVSMIIVACMSLSVMMCNEVIVPTMLRMRSLSGEERRDVGEILLNIRCSSIFLLLLLAYGYQDVTAHLTMGAIGVMSLSAIAQLIPAFLGGLIWRRGTGPGAIAGVCAGGLAWAACFLLPIIVSAETVSLHELVPVMSAMAGTPLRPVELDISWVVMSMVISLSLNCIAYIGVSLLRMPTISEQQQADLFVTPHRTPAAPIIRSTGAKVTVADLQYCVSRYVGHTRTEAAFAKHAEARGIELKASLEADSQMIRFTEHLLASTIGAASSRLVISLLIQRNHVGHRASRQLLDNASAAIQYNRELLQTAIDHVGQGLAVFDCEYRLVCWNRRFGTLLGLTPEMTRVGSRLEDILTQCARRGEFGGGRVDGLVKERLIRLAITRQSYNEHLRSRDLVLRVDSDSLPDGGFVATFTDVTEQQRTAEAITRANQNLERRVNQRTQELMHLNTVLDRARAEAEQANLGKTRFLAAASHDILQPLNAARLYTTSLVEHAADGLYADIARSIDASLESVEEILGALLDISRLDTGAMKPEFSHFRINDILRQLFIEFKPIAESRGLKLVMVPCGLAVRSDKKLLRRMLQNLVSNALRYTDEGRIIIGCRRRGENIRIDVYDTGPGIAEDKRQFIFQEFRRIDETASKARGLGLGLSIVERISTVLNHPVELLSQVGVGSRFAVTVPIASAATERLTHPVPLVTSPGQIRGAKVLCIDNDETILEGMFALLAGWECHVLKALDENEALELLRTTGFSPELMLVDYHLDHGTGIDAIKLIRGSFDANVPAVLVTADRSRELRELAAEEGCPILNKPIKPAALRAILAQRNVQQSAAE